MSELEKTDGFLWHKSDHSETVAYYEKFRQHQMECFARFVIGQGYGAKAPKEISDENGKKRLETWQQCGERLFGVRFRDVLNAEIDKNKSGHNDRVTRQNALF